MMFKTGLRILAAAVLSGALGVSAAQAYPDSAVTLITPFPAGGATDVLARTLVETMGTHFGQTLVVDNRPGATTNIGASQATRAKPDGYTLFLATNSTLVTNRYLYQKLPYDPDGFAPIGMIGVGPMVLLANPRHGFKTLEDVVAKARANPGDLTIASFGAGSSSHLAAQYLQQVAGIELLHIPYKGSTEAMPQLIAGETDLFFDMVSTGMPQVDAGKVDVVAITSPNRMSALPDIPTVAEQGYPGFEMTAWFTLVAPPATPESITDVVTKALGDALADEGLRERIAKMGIEPADGSRQALLDQIEKEKPVIQRLVKEADIAVQ